MLPKKNNRIVLNISGEIFETYEETLNRFPDTLLGNSAKRCEYYCKQSNQYHFYQCRRYFEAILFFYQSNGILTCPSDMNMDGFVDECNYFEIPEEMVVRMKKKVEILTGVYEIEKKMTSSVARNTRLWDTLEHPELSTTAWVYSICSMSAIFIALIFACLETMSPLKLESNNLRENPWFIAELVLNVWFLLEFLLRFYAAPVKEKFAKNPLNWIDGLAVIPYFISLAFSPNRMTSLTFLRCLRFILVIRLLRLSKQSKPLKVVSVILASSLAEFQAVMVCLAIIVTLGGSLMFYIEGYYSDIEQFSSIPECLYWAVQTITTVGYGDIIPLTVYGRLFSACFMIFGALTITLPVISLVTKFMNVYVKHTEGNRLVID